MEDDSFAKALLIAAEVHAEQRDKADKPYIGHILRLMERVNSEQEKIVALLHDVVEDSEYTLVELRQQGFSDEIVNAVDCMTRRSGESYSQFIERCATNSISRIVKSADLEDNMDIRRLESLTEEDVERLRKYLESYRYLLDQD